MLAELLEQDHGQQVRPGKAARCDMEWRRRLRNLLALPAGELLAHRLDYLPLPWDHLQCFGDILPELRQLRRPAARTTLWCGNDDTLARQMIGEWLARRPLALERLYRLRPGYRFLGRQLVLGRRRFQIFQLKFHLLQQPRFALRAAAVKSPPKLLDLKLEMGDQRFGAGVHRLGASRNRLRCHARGVLGQAGGSLRDYHRMRGGKIGWQRFRRRCHASRESYSSATAKKKPSAHRRRAPCLLRIAPIDSGQQVAELGRRDRHRAAGRTRPQEPTPFQSLREQAGSLTIVPDHLQQIAATTAKHKEMPAQRIAPQHLLHQQRQAREALPHVGMTGRQPNPHPARKRNHGSASSPRTSRSTAPISASRSKMIRRPFALTISTRPPTGSTACAGGSGVIVAGTKLAIPPSRPSRCNLRHVKTCCREIPCRRAVAEAARGSDKLSATIRSFSSSVQRRRRPVSTTSSRLI